MNTPRPEVLTLDSLEELGWDNPRLVIDTPLPPSPDVAVLDQARRILLHYLDCLTYGFADFDDGHRADAAREITDTATRLIGLCSAVPEETRRARAAADEMLYEDYLAHERASEAEKLGRATLWLIAQNHAAREGWDRKMLPPDDDADRGPLTDDELRWMDELNQEGARRGLPDWPRPDEIMHRRTCWLEDYAAGKTPREAIDKISHAEISVQIPLADLESINQFLATTHGESVCPYQRLDLPRLAAMLLEDVALMVRRPGSWEGSNMAQVMASHGYSF